MDINIKEIKQPYQPSPNDRVRVTHVHPRDPMSEDNKTWTGRECVVTCDIMPSVYMPGYHTLSVQPVDSEETYIFQALSVEKCG